MKKLLPLLIALLAAFASPVLAQKALPYTYGFEDNDLTVDGWTLVDCHANTGVTNTANAIHDGSYGFRFRYTTTPPQYIISPELTGTDGGVEVEFYYKEQSTSYPETFQVGYSTTTAEVTAFTWESEVTATTSWQLYSTSFPAGTKYVAVKCTSNDQYYLCLDDFSFTVPPTCPKPGSLNVSSVAARSAIVSWTSDADHFNLRYKASDDTDYAIVSGITGNSYTLEDLAPETSYAVSVQAVCSPVDQSDWTTDVMFTTPESCVTPTGWNSGSAGATEFTVSWRVGDTEQDTWQVAYASAATYLSNTTPNDQWQYQTVGQNSINVTGINPETTYYIAVRAVCGGGEYSKWLGPGTLTTEKLYPEPTNLTIDDITAKTATVSWTAGRDETVWNLRYRRVYPEVSVVWNFDDGMGDWTTIDSDGDGYAWEYNNTYDGHTAPGIMASASYINNVGALTPDNWLVSPQVELGGKLKFWAKGQDGTYFAEHFAVYVSTTGNTDVSNFVAVTDELVATNGWVQYTADLSAYSGNGYVAIRHYNCTDMFYLNIDDIMLIPQGAAGEDAWTVNNGITEESVLLEALTPKTTYEVQVQGVFGTEETEKSEWTSATFTTADLTPTNLTASGITYKSATLSWDGESCGYDVRYAKSSDVNEPTWLQYDDDSYVTSVGSSSSSTWTWGVMYPSSMVTATKLTKIAIYEGTNNTEDITVNIYTGGDSEPENLIGTQTVTPLANGWHEVTLDNAITLNRGENLWITLTETGTYVLTACESTEQNNQWIYSGGSWTHVGDLASSLANRGWMIRGYVDIEGGAATTWTTASTSETSLTLEPLEQNTDYVVQVRSNCPSEGGTTEWVTTYFTTVSDRALPSDLTAEDITTTSANIDWTVNGSEQEWNLRYRRVYPEVSVVWNFDDGMGDWTTIDSDGDGYAWEYNNTYDGHTAPGIMASASYINDVGALTPDNWLVSPQVELGGKLKFWAKGQDGTYFAEHFAVYVSTAGNTDVSDFVAVTEELESTNGWVQYTADLSAYTGQGYVAIRHYNVTDMFYLDIDDIALLPAGSADEEPWTVVNNVTTHPYTINGLDEDTEYEVQVRSIHVDGAYEWVSTTFRTLAEDDPTGIDTVTDEETHSNTDSYYNLQGVKLNGTPKQKGIYIINRKKVLVK